MLTDISVPFVNVGAQFLSMEAELAEVFMRVGRSGMYVMGDAVDVFEKKLAQLCECEYALTVGNGTDALVLALKALGVGPGDEVITAPNSFIASAGAIAAVGATIKFADVGADFNLDPIEVEKHISDKTKAIISVHLTGNPADMNALNKLAKRYQLAIVEDAAQAIGAEYKGHRIGSLGNIACFSLHPLKNFHLMGDAGFLTTNDAKLYHEIKLLRNHGLMNRDESAKWGLNSRCDTLQAEIGLAKLKYFEQWTNRFREIAKAYYDGLSDIVECPVWRESDNPVFHNFIIQVEFRERLVAKLADANIGCKIHYPIPLHLMKAAQGLGYRQGDFPVTEKQSQRILSLPIYPELTDQQVEHVIDVVRQSLRID